MNPPARHVRSAAKHLKLHALHHVGKLSQLQGHAQCTILVAFSPNAVGTQNDTLTVEGQNVQLTGRGRPGKADG